MMNWTSHIKEFRRRAPALLALLVFTAVAAEPAAVPPVVHSSYPAASAAAAADQSLVLLIFSAEWCGPCQQLKKRTLSAPEFLRQENPLHLADVDIDANQKMARDFAVDAVPTLVLLTADGKIIARRTGFLEAADLLAWLQAGRGRRRSRLRFIDQGAIRGLHSEPVGDLLAHRLNLNAEIAARDHAAVLERVETVELVLSIPPTSPPRAFVRCWRA